MRKYLAAAVALVAGLAAFAATCSVTHTSFVKIDGRDTFGGQIKNESGVDILAHKMRVSFFDNNNNLLETVTGEGCLRSLQNGAVDFFAARSTLAPAKTEFGMARLATMDEDPGLKVGKAAHGDARISLVSATRVGTTLTVKGRVTNFDTDSLIDPAACVVVRDNSDNVVLTGRDDAITSLDNSEFDTFTVELTVPDDVDLVDHVDVYVDGFDGTAGAAPIEPASLANREVVAQTPTPTP